MYMHVTLSVCCAKTHAAFAALDNPAKELDIGLNRNETLAVQLVRLADTEDNTTWR